MQNTLTSLSNLYFHPDLLRFLFSSIKKVCSDPFKSSSKHQCLHISRWFQPPSFKELFVQCKIESKGRLLPWRRATTGLQEKVEVSVWGKPARGRNFMFGWRRKFRFDWKYIALCYRDLWWPKCVELELIRKHECSKLVNKRNKHTDIKWPSGFFLIGQGASS